MELVSRQTGVHLEKLNAETRLLQDIGCDGDDAAILMMEFVRSFHVDAQNFELGKHLGSEGWDMRPWVLWRDALSPAPNGL